ncbi:transglutaminase-like cysteine peptidase, partial [Vibrio fluvialis]
MILLAVLTVSSLAGALNTQEQQWVDAVSATYGPRAGKRVATWRSEMARYRSLPEREQLTEVNRFFNQLYFVNDDVLWGKTDYWATPLEFLGSNA